MASIALSDFGGGLNTRDNPNELAPNETPDSLNWTLDTRRQARLRNGSAYAEDLPGTGGKVAFIFYSAALDQWLCARESGATLHLFSHASDITSGAWTDRGTINSVVTAEAAFVDFPGPTPKVVIATDVNSGATKGIWTWDGAALTNVSTTVAGNAIALWQNYVWVCGYPTSDANGNPTRLFRSKVGDPATWAVPDGATVEVRDKDAQRLTGLGIAAGALVVYKKRSAYRVSDSKTGAPATIDTTAGCVGPRAIVPVLGRLYGWGSDNIYEWDGVGAGKRVGDKIRPLYISDPLLSPGPATINAGAVEDRALFGYPYDAASSRATMIEYDPQHGWLMKHQFATILKGITSFARKEGDLYAAVVGDIDGVYKVFSETPGNDAGLAYATTTKNNFRTPWLQPAGGKRVRIERAQLEGYLPNGGSNTLTLRVYKDWTTLTYDDYVISSDIRAPDAYTQQATAILRSLGQGSAFAFEFLVGNATGEAAARSLSLDVTPLER